MQADTVNRLLSCGPLLGLGLALAIDPVILVKLRGKLWLRFRDFEHQLRPELWRPLLREPQPVEISRRARIGWRFAGAVLAGIAFLGIAGFIS
jgi:hypothetical protein